jgi:hypothetical protein
MNRSRYALNTMGTTLHLVVPENDRAVLTCWKDIAQYVGKSVRTVQRWERELEFPVRRTKHRTKGLVLAVPIEIDIWVRSQQSTDGSDRETTLLRFLHELRIENRELRSENRGLVRQLAFRCLVFSLGSEIRGTKHGR